MAELNFSTVRVLVANRGSCIRRSTSNTALNVPCFDPTRAGDLTTGKPVTVGADDDIETVLRTMADHKVRRLPVIDGHDLVGIISQADIARNLTEQKIGDLLEALSY